MGSSAEVGLVWAGVRHHLEPWLVDDIKEVLGIDGKSVSRSQHLLLVVLLETEAKKESWLTSHNIIFPTNDKIQYFMTKYEILH